ncbi:ATP11-domain-containing protein [Meredithblackwellia eburnea MCA 4105]
MLKGISPLARRSLRLQYLNTKNLHVRSISTSTSTRSATPEWQELIGGREVVERKKQLYQDKYKAAVENKAKQEGISVEQLKIKAELGKKAANKLNQPAPKSSSPVAAGSEGDSLQGPSVVRPSPSASEPSRKPSPAKDTPIKPLGDIMDLSKVSDLSSDNLAQLWTGFHQAKGFLSAAIPTETYLRMKAVANKYATFVLPLAREIEGETSEEKKTAVEMHLLQWAFLPPPAGAPTTTPDPSTVLFTPLAEFQSRQSFAQPYLILTHYTDLSSSHSLVLMRGEITDNVALSPTDAQVLTMRLQQFYNYTGLGGDKEEKRKSLLRDFHERPTEFNVDSLVQTAYDLD